MIYLDIALIITAAIIFLSVFSRLRKKRYTDFVLNNSKAIKQLEKLNKKYVFLEVADLKEKNTYDNENYYNNISCEDYLTYQLQFDQYAARQGIGRAKRNKEEFIRYSKEIAEINCFDDFIKSPKGFNKKLLNSIEIKTFKDKILSPTIDYKIQVILCCSTINGTVYARKKEIFGTDKIKELIRRLNDKNGAYYRDRGIWDAICRVERGKVSNKMRFSIYKRDGYRCRICGRSDRFADLEIDHIKPIAKGGKSTYGNLQTLCKRCNKEKGDKY